MASSWIDRQSFRTMLKSGNAGPDSYSITIRPLTGLS